MAIKLGSRIPWWKYVGNIVTVLVIIAQIVSVESQSGTNNDTGSVINPEQSNLTDFIVETKTEEVSILELLSVGEHLQSVIERLSTLPGGQVPSNSTLCTSRICKFKKQAQQLLEITEKLEQNKANSSNVDVAKLEEEYRSKYLQFNRSLDDMKEHILDAEKRYNEAMVSLEALKLKLEEYERQIYETKIIDATRAYINAQEFTKAYQEFNRLKYSDSNFQKVIEQPYLKFDKNAVEPTLAFIAEYPSCETRAPLYKFLFQFMNKYNMLSADSNLYDTKVYLFFDEIQSCSKNLEDIKKQLLINCDNITSKWVDDILNGRQRKIKLIQLFTNQTSKNETSFDIRLSDIVIRAYDDKVENIGKTAEFIHGLPNIMHVFKGYETLFNKMYQNDHFVGEEPINFVLLVGQTLRDSNLCSTVKNHPNLYNDFYSLYVELTTRVWQANVRRYRVNRAVNEFTATEKHISYYFCDQRLLNNKK